MKRPEGFGASPAPPGRAPESTTSPRRGSRRPPPADAPPPRSRATGSAPENPPSTDATTPPAPPAASPTSRELRREARRARRGARALERSAARERRRAERGEVRRFTRRSRRRRAVAIGAGVSFGTLIAGVVVVTFSPIMSLTTIEVTGVSRLDPAAIEGALEEYRGTSLAFLDDRAIGADLAEFSLIRSYATEIVPPNTLIVRIVERAPIGALPAGDEVDLVDAAGVVIDRVDAAPDGVPVIEIAGGEEGERAFEAIADVLVVIPRDIAARILSVTATTRDDVTFELRDGGHTVVWGDAERSAQKARVLDAAIAATDQGARWVYDVSAPDSLVVREAD